MFSKGCPKEGLYVPLPYFFSLPNFQVCRELPAKSRPHQAFVQGGTLKKTISDIWPISSLNVIKGQRVQNFRFYLAVVSKQSSTALKYRPSWNYSQSVKHRWWVCIFPKFYVQFGPLNSENK